MNKDCRIDVYLNSPDPAHSVKVGSFKLKSDPREEVTEQIAVVRAEEKYGEEGWDTIQIIEIKESCVQVLGRKKRKVKKAS
jgi:hypothetical protein